MKEVEDLEIPDDEDQYIDERFIEMERSNQKAASGSRYAKYMRAPVPDWLSETEDLVVMQLDIDYYIGKSPQPGGLLSPDQGIIRMFGLTADGNSVMVHVHDFLSYFYVESPHGFDPNPQNLTQLKEELGVRASFNSRVGKDKQVVAKIEVVARESIMHYKKHGNAKVNFLKIYVYQPSFVSSMRKMFEKGYTFAGFNFHLLTFESNMPYALRFMIDNELVGIGWFRLPANKFKFRALSKKISRCQIETEISYTDLVALPTDGEWNKIAPLRILSFDIECGAKVGFPHEDKDPVIQIASHVKVHTDEKPLMKNVFVLGTCSNIVDAEVITFDDERSMLKEWQNFVQDVDPDIIIGYNIINFDIPYIINRANHLKVPNFGYFSRMIGSTSKIKDTKYLSKAMGMRETKEINIEGRIQLDMMIHMHREQKLSSYSLNSVSFEFLKEQKEDVHHSIIYDLFTLNADTRRRLAVYCLKDAELPLKLMEKLMCLYNYTEMARVTGVPINYLFSRGQQIKVASQLYRKAKKLDIVIPTERGQKSDDSFEGAHVEEPVKGFYKEPIVTLDFASLYPSIMMAHNLCYSTLVHPPFIRELSPDDFIKTPSGNVFIKASRRKGLLPMILEDLIAARKKAKEDLKNATDPFVKAVLDGRQLALKISANSVYGFTGAQVGQLPCLAISASVTAFGREMFDITRKLLMEKYSITNGYTANIEIIYGDTDSVMVRFGVQDMATAMKLGKEAAEYVTAHFTKPIKLEFEKIYCPYLLIGKKRYAGLLWTKLETWDKIDKKGIESVRRDNCGLIRQMMNTLLNKLLVEQDVPGCVEYTKAMVSDLLQNKIDISNLVITKGISKKLGEEDNEEEKKGDWGKGRASKQAEDAKKKPSANQYKTHSAHVELAEKMRKRDATTAPNVGDRIQYLMICGVKGSKAYENAEDPLVALENDLTIDFNWYLEKQIKPPLLRLFEGVIPNAEGLFKGDHTRNIAASKLGNRSEGLGKFVVVKEHCLGCRVPIQHKGALCDRCEESKAKEIFLVKMMELRQAQSEFHEMWTQCQRCQGSLHQEVICQNRDCPIFYRRKRAQKELDNMNKVMNRFKTAGW